MLLDWIAQYYKLLWLAFAAVGLIKIVLSYSFHGNLEGVNGVLYALFKWYNRDEQQIEDVESRRTAMRLYNLITLVMYIILIAIFFSSLITMFLSRA